ncbi:MAG: thioredoxin family protein [Spirochaetota bacterium]|jgi:thiol-disulfide isomerase/thioredoxin|nr:thioredoxin family protein [Spirochaetota bacterium]
MKNTKKSETGGGRYSLLTESNFARASAGKLIFLDFTADWCPSCLEFAQVFAAVSAEIREANFFKVDADSVAMLDGLFGYTAVPYIIAVNDGKIAAEYEDFPRTAESYGKWVRRQIARYGGNR